MGAWCKKKHNWETATEKFYQHKLVFIHIPKTSGTSIANAVYGTFFGHYPLSSLRKNDAGKRLDSFETAVDVKNIEMKAIVITLCALFPFMRFSSYRFLVLNDLLFNSMFIEQHEVFM